MPAEPLPSSTLMLNPHCNSLVLPHFQWVPFQGWLYMKRAMGRGGSEPVPGTCTSPTCTGDAVTPFPKHLSLRPPCQVSTGLGLAAALGWTLLCQSAYGAGTSLQK